MSTFPADVMAVPIERGTLKRLVIVRAEYKGQHYAVCAQPRKKPDSWYRVLEHVLRGNMTRDSAST